MEKCRDSGAEMILVECKCADCRTNFKVDVKKSLPPWDLVCPVCEGKIIVIKKINGSV